MQVDLDDRLLDDLKLDEAEVLDREPNRVVVGVRVSERRVKLRGVRQYPLTFRGDQDC